MIDKNKPLYVVTDPGVDDMVALVLLSKLHKAPVAVYATFGNASADITYQNTLEFLSAVSVDWDLYQGATLPLSGKVEHVWPDYFHGPDGIWNVRPPFSHLKIPDSTTDPKYQQIISLSPLTTLLKLNEKCVFDDVTIMGGAFLIEGNETKYAETNIAFDVDAACKYFDLTKTQTRVVSLDVTRKVMWSQRCCRDDPRDEYYKQVVKRIDIGLV
jgi:inosine-uridine nucleoside N-ribohydrolase